MILSPSGGAGPGEMPREQDACWKILGEVLVLGLALPEFPARTELRTKGTEMDVTSSAQGPPASLCSFCVCVRGAQGGKACWREQEV